LPTPELGQIRRSAQGVFRLSVSLAPIGSSGAPRSQSSVLGFQTDPVPFFLATGQARESRGRVSTALLGGGGVGEGLREGLEPPWELPEPFEIAFEPLRPDPTPLRLAPKDLRELQKPLWVPPQAPEVSVQASQVSSQGVQIKFKTGDIEFETLETELEPSRVESETLATELEAYQVESEILNTALEAFRAESETAGMEFETAGTESETSEAEFETLGWKGKEFSTRFDGVWRCADRGAPLALPDDGKENSRRVVGDGGRLLVSGGRQVDGDLAANRGVRAVEALGENFSAVAVLALALPPKALLLAAKALVFCGFPYQRSPLTTVVYAGLTAGISLIENDILSRFQEVWRARSRVREGLERGTSLPYPR
jgi:hypothetical protein